MRAYGLAEGGAPPCSGQDTSLAGAPSGGTATSKCPARANFGFAAVGRIRVLLWVELYRADSMREAGGLAATFVYNSLRKGMVVAYVLSSQNWPTSYDCPRIAHRILDRRMCSRTTHPES